MGMVAGAGVIAGACVAAGVVGLAVSKQSWCEYPKGCGALGELEHRGSCSCSLKARTRRLLGKGCRKDEHMFTVDLARRRREAPALVLLGAAVDGGVSTVVGVAEVAAHEGQGHR